VFAGNRALYLHTAKPTRQDDDDLDCIAGRMIVFGPSTLACSPHTFSANADIMSKQASGFEICLPEEIDHLNGEERK